MYRFLIKEMIKVQKSELLLRLFHEVGLLHPKKQLTRLDPVGALGSHLWFGSEGARHDTAHGAIQGFIGLLLIRVSEALVDEESRWLLSMPFSTAILFPLHSSRHPIDRSDRTSLLLPQCLLRWERVDHVFSGSGAISNNLV